MRLSFLVVVGVVGSGCFADVYDHDIRNAQASRALETSLKMLEARKDFLGIWKPYAKVFEDCLRKARRGKGWSPRSPPVEWRRLQFMKYTLPKSLLDVHDLQVKKDFEYAFFWATGKLQQQYRRMSELNKIIDPCVKTNWDKSLGDPVWTSYMGKRIKEGFFDSSNLAQS